MPAPAAAAARAALAVVRTRRGRRLLLSVACGLTLGLATVVVVLLSSVGAVLARCQQTAERASQGVPVATSGVASGGPAYVSQKWSKEALSDIPADYLPIYEKAAKDYGLDGAILAAIGKVESDHGRASAPGVTGGENYAGAGGPMQFLASSWANLGVDGNGDGVKDRYDPEDAIPAAANYLKMSGAPEDYHSAILAYNHAEWYYQRVAAQANEYRASGEGGDAELALIRAPGLASFSSSVAPVAKGIPEEILSALGPQPALASEASSTDLTGGEGRPDQEALFPLPDGYFDSYSDDWGPHHEGTDLLADEGTLVTAIVGGRVVGPSGHSGDEGESGAVMVEAAYSSGPVHEGDVFFYANLAGESVGPGDTVEAGEKIGTVGGSEAGQKDDREAHLHLGWYDPSGTREEAASGAMNPYPLLEWIVEGGGSATGSGLAPGVAAAELPAYCVPLRLLGLVPEVANPAGGPSIAGASPTSGGVSGGVSGGASGAGGRVVAEAKKYLGVPYVLGGPEVCDPGVRMDCTCLTTTVFEKFGYSLPDCPTCLWDYGEPVQGPPQAGDILVWDDPGDGTGGHVAIALGGGRIIHANMGTMDVATTPMWDSPQYMGARRLVH